MIGKKLISCVLVAVIVSMSPITNITSLANSKTPEADVITVNATTTYPTPWANINNTIYTSKKATKSGKAILAAGIVTAVSAAIPVAGVATKMATVIKTFGTSTASILLTNYFVNSDVENVYYTITFAYREIGPNYTDTGGNVYGQYEVKVTCKSYSDSKRTVEIATESTTYKESSMANYFWY